MSREPGPPEPQGPPAPMGPPEPVEPPEPVASLDHAAAEALVARTFAGPPPSPAEARALRAHLRACAACRAEYDAWAESERALALASPTATQDPEAAALLAAGLSPAGVARLVAAGLDLGPVAAVAAGDSATPTVAAVPASSPAPEPARRATGRSAGRRAGNRARWLPFGVAAGLAAGLALWLGGTRWFGGTPPAPEPLANPNDAPVARGGEAPVARGGKAGAPSLRVFAAPTRPGEAPTPAGARLDPGAGVLFSYSNPADSAARWLAVVGRDAAGNILWFAPVWAAAEDRPTSLPLAVGVADREVPRLAFVAAAPGPLEICGWFTTAPVAVAEVDAALAAGAWPPGAPAGAPGAAQAGGQRDCHRFEVPR